MRQFLIILLMIVVMLILVVVAVGYIQASALVHPRNAPVRFSPDDVGVAMWRDAEFTTEDNLTLRGWFVPPQRDDQATLVFVHGISGNRENFLRQLPFVYAEGYGALLFDLRNHGESDGTITTMAVNEVLDVNAAVDFVSAQAEVDPENIVIFSHSMGGATSIRALPALPQIRGLIVDTAYTSVEEVVSDGVRDVIGRPFFLHHIIIQMSNALSGSNFYESRPIDVVGEIAPRPILFIHGTADRTIPVEHIHDLHEAASEPKELLIVEDAGHIMAHSFEPDIYEERVLTFLENIFE